MEGGFGPPNCLLFYSWFRRLAAPLGREVFLAHDRWVFQQGDRGRRGAQGAAGGAGGATEFTQSTPSAAWVVTHSLGRFPVVDVFVSGERVFPDVTVTTTQISVSFPSATSGKVVYG
jgi:hypothetical protein